MKEGWEYKKLGDIGTFIRGGNFSKKDFVEDGFPCIHYGQIHMKFGVETLRHISSVPAEMVKNDRCAKKGDLVIAITSEDDAGSCKCTAWMGDYDVYVGGHTAIYRHTMQPKYVSYYFMSPYFQKDKLEYTHGFKVVEISPKDIAKISIPVPPLSEQQSIVDYLDSAFAKIDAMKANAEKALNEAKALFQASLKEMLEPKEGWEEKKLGDIGELKNGMNFSKNQSGYNVHILGVGDFGNLFQIDNTDYLQTISLNSEPSEEYILKNKDIVFVRSNGNKNLVGRCVLIHVGNEPCSFSGFCIRLRKSTNEVDACYLTHFLKTEGARRKLVGNGANISNLNQKILSEFVVSYPSIQEQQSIVDTLDSLKSKVDRLQENYDKISQECDALKQAILRQVFE